MAIDDVVPADDKQGKWIIDPFQMKEVNGYIYGRGVTDNKGPIMAALYGVVDLVHEKSLDSDITFLIEGEEESGSRGGHPQYRGGIPQLSRGRRQGRLPGDDRRGSAG